MRHPKSPGFRRLLVIGTLLAGLLLLVLAIGSSVAEANRRAETQLDERLRIAGDDRSQRLSAAFEQARAISVLLGQNPSFADYYDDRFVEDRARVLSSVDRSLLSLEALYPTEIGEACFIDLGGHEIARVVRGQSAAVRDLSPDERGNPFFAPTLTTSPTSAHQARPYVSADTHEWVIANATPVVDRAGAVRGIVHFELRVEGLRGKVALGSMQAMIVDTGTGRVVADSGHPVVGDRPLEAAVAAPTLPADRTRSATYSAGAHRVVFTPLPRTSDNANHWAIVTLAPRHDFSLFGGLGRQELGIGAEALLMLLLAGLAVRSTTRTLRRQAALRTQQARQLEAQTRDLREFAHAINHELREPLRKVSMLATRLRRIGDALPAEARGYTDRIVANAETMRHLLDAVAAATRVQAHAARVERTTTAEIIASARASLESADDVGDLELVVSGDVALDGDRERLVELVRALLAQALDAHESGRRCYVAIIADTVASDLGPLCRLRIEDAGRPLAADADPFRVFHTEVSGGHTRLTICRHICERHGGSIAVEPGSAGGTCFVVLLPIRAVGLEAA